MAELCARCHHRASSLGQGILLRLALLARGPLAQPSYSCPECHSSADPLEDHQVGCGGNGDGITRHNAIWNVLYSAAQSAALGPTCEAPGLVADSMSFPAVIFLPTWHQGRPVALDVHIISSLQQQLAHEAASMPGYALEVDIQRKLTSHLTPCCDAGVEFIPVVAEMLGGLSEDTIGIIRTLTTVYVYKFLLQLLWPTGAISLYVFHCLFIYVDVYTCTKYKLNEAVP